MVNISKIGDSAIKFTFTDNDRYLYNGEITLPLNSLILEFDTSDLVIFKKIDGDVFVTFLLENSNFDSKNSLIEFYKTSMVGSTGGGVDSGTVQTMIDESISGKVNVSDNVVSAHTFNARSADEGGYITKLKFNGRHFGFNDFHSKKISVYPFANLEGQLFTSLYLEGLNYASYDVAAYLSGSTNDDYPSSFTSVTWTGDETKMKAEINSEGYLDLIAQGDYWFGQIDSNVTHELYVNILNDIASGQSASVINDSIVNNLENLGNTINGIQHEINGKLDASAYTPINVDSTLSQTSTNPIQNKSLFNELRVSGASSGETTIVFVNRESTNYLEGVTVIKFEPTQSNTWASYEFYNGNSYLGSIQVSYYGSISVELSLDGATYTTSGNTVILTVPTSLGINKIAQLMGEYDNFTVKVENPPIYTTLKDVVANKQDTLIAGENITISGNVISANGVQVSSAVTSGDTNPVAGGALYDELRIENAPVETTLTFTKIVGEDVYWTTNYPSGCTTLVGNILAFSTQIELYNNSIDLGGFIINCYEGVLDSVIFWGIEGTYSISGSVVTISYPNVTNVTRFRIREDEYHPDYQTYKAMATVAPTVLKNQVNDNTTALGGLKLVKISQSDYENLQNKDNDTLYVILGS